MAYSYHSEEQEQPAWWQLLYTKANEVFLLKKQYKIPFLEMCLEEMAGSFLIVTILLLGNTYHDASVPISPKIHFLQSVTLSLLFAFSLISGRHFNPAMTYAYYIIQHHSDQMNSSFFFILSTAYVCFQYIGSVLATTLYWISMGHPFILIPYQNRSVWIVFLFETFLSAFFFLATLSFYMFVHRLTSKKFHSDESDWFRDTIAERQFLNKLFVNDRFRHISAGLALSVACFICSYIFRVNMNPAFSSAISTTYYLYTFGGGENTVSSLTFVPYWLGPYCGATLAAYICRICLYSNTNLPIKSRIADYFNLQSFNSYL